MRKLNVANPWYGEHCERVAQIIESRQRIPLSDGLDPTTDGLAGEETLEQAKCQAIDSSTAEVSRAVDLYIEVTGADERGSFSGENSESELSESELSDSEIEGIEEAVGVSPSREDD